MIRTWEQHPPHYPVGHGYGFCAGCLLACPDRTDPMSRFYNMLLYTSCTFRQSTIRQWFFFLQIVFVVRGSREEEYTPHKNTGKRVLADDGGWVREYQVPGTRVIMHDNAQQQY